MNLQNMIQRQVGIEQAKKEANRVGSVTANDVINLATTSDRLLRESINTAFKNAQEFPTSENLKKQIEDLSNFKEQAMLPATKVAFDMGIKNLQDYKLMQETRTKKGMELFTSARNLNTDDLESITSLRKDTDNAFANQLIGSQQYEAILAITEPKYKEADSKLDFAKEFAAVKRFDEVFEESGTQGVNELIYETFTKTEDPSTLTRLAPFAKSYIDNVNAKVEAFQENQENAQEMQMFTLASQAKEFYENIQQQTQGDTKGNPIAGQGHANKYRSNYVLKNINKGSFNEKYFMKGAGVESFNFDAYYDDALQTIKALFIIDEDLGISKSAKKNMDTMMDKSNPMHFDVVRNMLNSAIKQIDDIKKEDPDDFAYDPLRTSFVELGKIVDLYQNNRKAMGGTAPVQTDTGSSYMSPSFQVPNYLDDLSDTVNIPTKPKS